MILGATWIAAVARRIAPLAFALWLAGAGHLVCCASVCADHSVARVASREHEPDAMGAAHSCCHARLSRKHHVGGAARGSNDITGESDAAITLTERRTSHVASRCCVSGGQTGDRTARPRMASDPTRDGATHHSSRDHVATVQVDPPSPVSRSLDRGGTYLRCCVFLI